MKGLYVIWPDFDYIDRAIEAGIDTLFVSFHSLPDDSNPSDYFDTFNQSKAVLQRYRSKNITLIPIYTLYNYWASYDKNSCFYENTISYENGFCPVNEEAIERAILPFYNLIDQGFCDSFIWDVEHYSVVPHIYKEKIKCDCPSSCINLPWEDQWKTRANIIKKYPKLIGQLCYNSWWSMYCYNNTSLYLTGATYDIKGKKFIQRFSLWKDKKLAKLFHGIKYNIIPGAFLEIFPSTNDYIDYLKWLKSHCPYDGYWIYTQQMMSNYSKISQQEMNQIANMYNGFYQNKKLNDVDPLFFSKLKEINKL